jgi:ABC-type glycerol-3-phosphate transport system permease component
LLTGRARRARVAARRWRRPALGALAAIPFLFLAAFSVAPLLDQAYGSLFSWYDIHPSAFAGLRYYALVFENTFARASVVHSVVYLALTVPIEVAFGLGGAWLVLRARSGRAVFTVLFVLPLVIPWSAAGALFLGVLNQGGILDVVLAPLGVHEPLAWSDNVLWAFAAIVVAGIWKGAPWCFLLLLAALGACPAELFEAGRVDGARGVAYWRYVVVPAVWPMLLFVTAFRVFAEAQAVEPVALLTQGGPLNATQLLATYADEMAFNLLQFPTSAALATAAGGVLIVVASACFALLGHPPGSAPARLRLAATAGCSPLEQRGARRAGPERPSTRRPAWRKRAAPNGVPSAPAAKRRRRSSAARARRRRAAALVVLAVLVCAPLAGGIPGGSVRPDFSLPWAQVETGIANSALLTVVTVCGTLVLSIPAAYVLSRWRLRWRGLLFLLVLLALAIPGALVLLPQAQELVWLGLMNTRLGLALLYVAADMPLAVFFLRAAFAAVPDDLVEAMRVDGASPWRILSRLVVPLSANTVVAVVVFTVIQVWNDSLVVAVMTTSPSLETLPELAANGIGASRTLAVSWLSIAPPLLVFLAAQRAFRRGVAARNLL